MQDAIVAGFRWYAMGESGTSSSLTRFKAQFGADAYDYHEFRRESLPVSQIDRVTRSVVKRVIGFREATRRSPQLNWRRNVGPQATFRRRFEAGAASVQFFHTRT